MFRWGADETKANGDGHTPGMYAPYLLRLVVERFPAAGTVCARNRLRSLESHGCMYHVDVTYRTSRERSISGLFALGSSSFVLFLGPLVGGAIDLPHP